MSRSDETVFGRLVRRPERAAPVQADGRLSNGFAFDQTRQEAEEILRQNGLVLRDDDSVVRQPTGADCLLAFR